MDRDGIVCIFCGGRADIKEQDNLKIVSCPECKRETDLETYQGMFDKWMGDINHAVRTDGGSVPVSHTLLSLTLYLVEELPRILDEIRMDTAFLP
jgi:hypothetical protein